MEGGEGCLTRRFRGRGSLRLNCTGTGRPRKGERERHIMVSSLLHTEGNHNYRAHDDISLLTISIIEVGSEPVWLVSTK